MIAVISNSRDPMSMSLCMLKGDKRTAYLSIPGTMLIVYGYFSCASLIAVLLTAVDTAKQS